MNAPDTFRYNIQNSTDFQLEIYITEDTHGKCWDLNPVLFETQEQAEDFAKSWRKRGKERYVQVVEYDAS